MAAVSFVRRQVVACHVRSSEVSVLKFVLPFGLIWLMFEAGNALSRLIEPIILIPGSILGMMLMFVLLLTGLVKMEWLTPVTNLFLKHMSFFFVPLGVGLLGALDLIAPIWMEMTFLLILSNLAVMLGVGWTVQWLANREKVRP